MFFPSIAFGIEIEVEIVRLDFVNWNSFGSALSGFLEQLENSYRTLLMDSNLRLG